MSLIFAKDSSDFVAVADIALSRPVRAENQVALPFHRGSLKFSSGGYELSGVAQKMTIAKNSLVMWAGSYVVAKTLLKLILEMSEGGKSLLYLKDVVQKSGLSEPEISEVSMIYFCISDDQVVNQSLNCQTGTAAGQKVWGAGTGLWDYADNTTGGFDLDSLIARTVLNLASEAWSSKNYEFLYGGWFEIATISEQLRFKKLSYALKFWRKGADGVVRIDAPCVYSAYRGSDLIITTVYPGEDPLSSETYVHLVTDFADRRSLEVQRPPPWRPDYLIHVVSRAEDNLLRFVFETENQSFSMKMGKTGPTRTNMSRSFLDRIANENFSEIPKMDVNKGVW